MVEAIAKRCVRHRRWVTVIWLALLGGLIVLSVAARGATHDDDTVTGVDSTRASDLLESAGMRFAAGKEVTVVFHDATGVTTPRVKQSVDAFLGGVRREVPHVSVTGPFESNGARQVSADGTTAYARLNLAPRSAAQRDAAARTMTRLCTAEHLRGLQIALDGDIFAASSRGGPGEGIGVLAAALILLIAFGSALAAGLPLMVAGFGAGTGVAVVGVAANLIDMPSAATPVAVTHHLGHTSRVISLAAAITVCVFASFVFGDARDLKLFGFGLAVSLFVDATLVSLVLLPAAMDLLGERNWWLPRRLARVLPRLTVEADDHDTEISAHQTPRLCLPDRTAVTR